MATTICAKSNVTAMYYYVQTVDGSCNINLNFNTLRTVKTTKTKKAELLCNM